MKLREGEQGVASWSPWRLGGRPADDEKMCFSMLLLVCFSVSFSVSFFSVLKTYGSPKRAPLEPLLGPKMEPKSFQGGLEVACHGQSENLQIPCVLQYFCGPVGVPSRLKIVFNAVLSSSLGISIFVSFLNPFRSSKKVICSVK